MAPTSKSTSVQLPEPTPSEIIFLHLRAFAAPKRSGIATFRGQKKVKPGALLRSLFAAVSRLSDSEKEYREWEKWESWNDRF